MLRKLATLTLFHLLLCSFMQISAEVPNPIIEQPTADNKHKEKILKIYNDTPKPFSFESWYTLSQQNIKYGNLDAASSALLQAIRINPDFVEAHIQLAYVYLWLQDYPCAEMIFDFILQNFSCNKFVYAGLEEIAHEYEKKEESRQSALNIYLSLLKCLPDNPDYYLYIGRLLNWMDHSQCAKTYLKKCLELLPSYYDAAAILASIYIKEKLYYEAKNLYSQYPKNMDALAGLAKIASLQNNYSSAQNLQERILLEEPNNNEIRNGLARSLYLQQYYRQARKQFLTLINKEPCNDDIFKEYDYNVKPYTNIALIPEFSYTKAKENDRSLKKPVVRNLYVLGSLNLFLPINDQWRIDSEAFVFRQKEKDILPPTTGNNYNVYMSGAKVTSHVYHSRVWRWDVSATLFRAWSEGAEFYPFSDTTNFEPATYAIYDDKTHLFVVGGNYESFVIKNFSKTNSELLRFVYTEARYGYRFKNLDFAPEINGWVSWSFYNDKIHNRKELQSAWVKSHIPGFTKTIRLTYLAEHSGFLELSRNYYSYERQWLNILGVIYHYEISTKSYCELSYEQSWRSTRNLFLPVGDTVFVAKKLFIRGHRPAMKIGYRYRDKVTVEASGHYYRDTYPYRDYGLEGKILWYF
ncbi:MAG: hypothetical protein VX777_01650 [Chlamydiota bacterium]|nr:hypothetical protein [Chlamydiota bacterium]